MAQPNLERQRIKKMLSEWDQQAPDRVSNVFRSMQNITSSHLLDKNLFDFENMQEDTANSSLDSITINQAH